MEEDEVNSTPSDKSNSSKKKYTPTPKLSERKRSLFRISNKIEKPIAEEEEPLSSDLHSDHSLDGLEFCDNDNEKLPAKSSLLKSSSFLTRIEDINNDDFLLSADSSNDFEIPVQKSIEIELPKVLKESEKTLNFHNFIASVKKSDSSPSPVLTKESSKFIKHLSNSSVDSNTVIPETPPKKNTPRTPYETLNTDLQLPRMNNRKSLLGIFKNFGENISNIENLNDKYINDSNNEKLQNLLTSEIKSHGLKRALETSTPDSIPSKVMKLDDKKSPKARTSLFASADENKNESEDSGVSPKMFYRPSLSPVKKSNTNELSFKSDSKIVLRSSNRQSGGRKNSVFLCGRSKKRNSFGEINAGVRTGIKKPKLKNKITQSTKKHLFKEEALKLLREKQDNYQTPSIWNKKIISKFSKVPSILPSDKVNEMDQLIQKIKQPTVVQNVKRSHEVPLDTSIPPDASNIIQEPKRIKLEEKLKENKENVEGKPRKFFKSGVSNEKCTVKLVNNITLKFQNGKMKMQSKPLRKIHTSRPYTFDATDLTVDSNVKLNNMDEVIKHLDEIPDKEESSIQPPISVQSENGNKLVLSAHYSCSKDDNSIILHQPPPEIEMKDIAPQNPVITKLNNPEDIIMSPTSLMCDMTSGLALTSPKKHINITKAANLTDKLSNCPTKDEIQKSQSKVYPVFVKGHQSTAAQTLSYAVNRKNFSTRNRRIWKTLDDRQYQIDAGQRKWGVTQCPTCEVVYSQNEPEDEQRHLDFHNKVQYLRFNGWKNEKIVGYCNFNRARIIEVGQNDSKVWWKRITDLLFVIDRELGYSNLQVINSNVSKVYLYIENKQIHGFLSAVPIKEGYRMIPTENVDCCSQTPSSAKCGVTRIWVASSYRRKKIATNLMNALRKSFIMGYHLTVNDLAFSTPSTSGKLFIQNYTKTNEYLI
ncbi:N-acetyltransferase ESCO2, partial [Chrysoperla carnea]|uniref:N-acetyltransferase ESCO2 n=1 Tax=Chrysoperla carnea TaxID=189513 RepID=UPI001D0744CD